MPTKPDFIIRLEEELGDLQIKINKLSTYLSDEERECIKIQNDLLKVQLTVMKSYEQILIVRLDLLDN